MNLRPDQLKVMNAAINKYKESQNVIVEAPNGYGKSFLATYILNHNKPAIYAAPSHMEVTHAISIYKQNFPNDNVVHLMSKDHLCNNNVVALLDVLPKHVCTPGYRRVCPKFTASQCEYYIRQKKAEEADVIFLPHSYLGTSTGIKLLQDRFLVLDEVHAFASNIMTEKTLRYDTITKAAKISDFKPRNDSQYKKLSRFEKAKVIINHISEYTDDQWSRMIDYQVDSGNHENVHPLESTRYMAQWIGNDCHVTDGEDKICGIPENPARHSPREFLGLTGTVTGAVNISFPKSKYIKIKGYTYPRLKIYIDKRTTTKYNKRDINTAAQYVYEHLKKNGATHTAIYTTSKAQAETLANLVRLEYRDNFKDMPKTYIVVEGHASTENSVRKFRETGGIIISAMRGKIAQGIDMPEVECTIIYGVPYPMMTDSVKFYTDKYGFGTYYRGQALAAVTQAVGRGIRSKHDTNIVYLLDSRFKQKGMISGMPGYMETAYKGVIN